MLVEQLIFVVISFAFFSYMFFKMIKNNDTIYVAILVIEAIGIALDFLEVLFKIELNILFMILKYIFAIIIPIVVIILEKKNVILSEFMNIRKAKSYILSENYKKAKQACLDILEKDSENYMAHKMLAEIYEKEGGTRKAIDEYVLAIDINKQDYNSYYKVSELLNGLGKKDEAIEMLYMLLNKKPDVYEATELLGDILIEKEMYKEAISVYQDALKYNPSSYDINYNLGIVYTMLNDFQSAKEYYDKAAQLNTLLYVAKYSLAEIALIYKEIDEAENRFLELVNIEELSADAYFELAKINMIKGEKIDAINYINTAIDTKPDKIIEKVKKETIFIPIMAKIVMPFNVEINEEIPKKDINLKEKERKAKEHLEEMVDITRHLGYNDINLLKRHSENNKQYKKNQNLDWKEKQRDE